MSPGVSYPVPPALAERLEKVEHLYERGVSLEEIRRELSDIVREFPAHPEGRFQLAATYAGEPARAAELVDEAAAVAPDDPVVLVRAAELLLGVGRLEASVDYLKRLSPMLSQDDVGLTALASGVVGQIHYLRGALPLAEEALSAAFQVRPDIPRHGAALARLYRTTGRTTQAHEVIREALEHAPHDPELLALARRATATTTTPATPSRWRHERIDPPS